MNSHNPDTLRAQWRATRHRRLTGGGVHRRSTGVGLLEVLIAAFILSVGFLAAANMQVSAMQANQASMFNSQAGLLIAGMVDRMRSNPEGVDGGYYSAADTDESAAAGNCVESACTPRQQAVEDIALWRRSLVPANDQFPALPVSSDGKPARGTITAQLNGVFALTMSWEAVIDGDIVRDSLTMRVRP